MAPTNAQETFLEVQDFLKGIRYRNSTVYESKTHASMAGGMEIFIHGSGMDESASQNQVLFTSHANTNLVLPGTPLDQDDEIQSATTQLKLAYTLPSLTDLFGVTSMDAFNTHYVNNNNDEAIGFNLQVENLAESTIMSCESSSKCDVTYRLRYTPLLQDISPSNVYWDQDLTIWVNAMATQKSSVIHPEADPVDFIKLSGTRCDSEDYFNSTTRLSEYQIDSLVTRSGDQHPGDQIPEVRFRGGNAFIRETAKHCNFAGTECWNVRTHPYISAVSAVEGYQSGGQELTITGWGLKGTNDANVEVMVDGVPCSVTSHSLESIKCTTGSKTTASLTGVSQPGGPGLTQHRVTPADGSAATWEMRADGSVPFTDPRLQTAFENAGGLLNGDAFINKGWFKAPAAGNYRFYISCNDKCKFFMDETNPFNAASPGTQSVTEKAARHWSTSFRNYNLPPDPTSSSQYISSWIPLQAGEFYKVEGYAMGSSNDHFTVSVEYEQAQTVGHHHANKEIQLFKIEQVNVHEIIEFSVTQAKGSLFRLQFVNPNYDPTVKGSVQFWTSENMVDNINAAGFKNYTQGYFKSIWGSDISVTKTDYDDQGNVAASASLIHQSVYQITILKMINGPSYANVAILQADTSVTMAINKIQDSTAPIGGSFFLQCFDDQQQLWETQEFPYNQWVNTIDFYIQLQVPHLQFKIQARDQYVEYYRENGFQFSIEFQDYHGDVPQCEIMAGITDPLTGNSPTLSSTTERVYGQNLMFEPIPMEMLYADAMNPQVTVKVNGLDGVCPKFNCDYNYFAPTAQITSQALNGGSWVLVYGTNLPVGPVTVKFATSVCLNAVSDGSMIECQLDYEPAAGFWNVEVIDKYGLIPLASTVSQISVALSVTGVFPQTGLNQLGGDIITFMGTGFDHVVANNKVTFSDATVCTVIATSKTNLECMVEGFDPQMLNTAANYDVIIEVHNIFDNSQYVNMLPTKQSGVSVSPNSISPVLSTVITVSLESTYPHALQATDFQAMLVSNTDSTITRKLYVVSVDDANKQINLKFPGASSGSYRVQLSSTQVGRIDKTPLDLTVEGKVTSFSPNTGSYLGGTLVTINGVNFSNDPLDNPVKVGNNYCLVETTNAQQITCRIMETFASTASQAQLLVFLRTSEEAQASVPTTFSFATPIATITSMMPSFDTNTNSQIVTISGSGFPSGNLSGVKLYIDGVAQQTTEVVATSATFMITDMKSHTSNNVRVYFPDGLATNYDQFTSITFTPTFVSVSPQVGSSGGTLLTINAPGIGSSSTGLNIKHIQTGGNICLEVNVISYGVFTCRTAAVEILDTDGIMLTAAGADHNCGNQIQQHACTYSQIMTSSPLLQYINKQSSTQLLVEGSNFPTLNSGYTPVVEYKGVRSSSATLSNNGIVTATFDKGIPVSATPAEVTLRFENSSTGEAIYAVFQTNPFANDLAVSSSTQGLFCSFAGGCSYSVNAEGLTAALLDSTTNSIDVCGNPCAIDANASTDTQTVCTLPHISTAFSAAQFEIVQAGILTDGKWSGSAAATEVSKLYDGKNTIDYTDSSAPCHFQIQFKENHVAVLDEVKFFVTDMIDKSPFNGNLFFQGSMDGNTFVDLFTVDGSVHEGWNYHDFDPSNKPAYNVYRFEGTQAGSCRIAEVRFDGIESINSQQDIHDCVPKIILDDTTTPLNVVVYAASMTPVLTGMSDRFGSVLGNEQLTLTGTGFVSNVNPTVMIDSRPCTVTSFTSTQIVCTTADKPWVPDEPSLVININGKGNVATMGHVYRYVSRWSDPQTWGGDIAPIEGDAVNIPKGQHLLFDIDSSPILSFVNVEGSLIFAPDANPNHERNFAAHYILVKGGYMEVGTEANRYTSKMTITMYSTKYDPNLPIFGNKVIGVNYGSLEMHGVLRSHTWTDLKFTADAGATQITLNDVTGGVPLDWAVGEEIVIASTDISGRNAEQRTITAISNTDTNPVITLDSPLVHKHYAGVQYFGNDFIEMRAEVGLLTRNVKYQGDESGVDNQYGAVIIAHSPGDESTVARIDSVELTRVGQAFILGSYPIHFHMIGTVHSSYVRNNAIHHTFNRAVTIHGVHYLRVQNNVAYHTMGHTIFIEDAAETKNLIEDNLVVDVRRSWSLLNTDQTPACFWITNPDNIFRRNHAAGSDRYSYWFDTQTTAIGPSFDTNICPENTKLGEFVDNHAHSNGRYGLRIFHNLIPRTYPCEPMVYDATDPNNPYPNNPPIIAHFHNLVSWKNGRNGAIAERVGAVQFHNFKTADNVLAGIEFSLTEDIIDGYAKVIGGLVVGRTENTQTEIDIGSPHGIITPRTENFSIEGTKFYNYNWNNAAALGTCSHCFHAAATDSGARTIRVSNLAFDQSVQKRIFYQYPYRAIFLDETGSLTNLGANSWAIPFWQHNTQPECQVDDPIYNGIICDSSVQVRRVAFHGGSPGHFQGMEMKIAKYDNSIVSPMEQAGTLQQYLDDNANYSRVIFKSKLKPSDGWAMPYVTGHKYRVHWGEGLDFEWMNVEVSERWQTDDKYVLFNLNFTETREAVNFTSNGQQIMNETIIKPTTELESGDNIVYNDTETREIMFAVTGKNQAKRKIQMQGLRCISGTCPLPGIEIVPMETHQRLWSDVQNWDGTLPAEGDDVEIPSGWDMLLDIEETPVLNSLTVNGRLTFIQNNKDIHLRAKQIFVRAGELFIGNETHPFENQATITLMGKADDETLVLSGTVSAGNKILATVGDVKFYGKPRDRMSRLYSSASAGSTQIIVDTNLDWKQGDEIFIAPTSMQYDFGEYRTIAAYQGGVVTLDAPLKHYHYGDFSSTEQDYNGVDIRGEVILLSRNIKVQGDGVDGWGGQIMATDIFEFDGTWRKGQIHFDHVQVYNCSQRDTFKAAIRFEGATGGSSVIKNSVVHNSLAWSISILKSNNVKLLNSAFVGSLAIGVHMDFVRDVVMDGCFTGDTLKRRFTAGDMVVDKEACNAICSYLTQGSICTGLTITNNIAAGCKFAGFVVPGHDCDQANSQTSFRNNVAHSSLGTGAHIYPAKASSGHSKCYEGSHFSAYKNTINCVATHYPTAEIRMSNINCIDNQKGLSLQTGGDRDKVSIRLFDSFIYGETKALDCVGKECYCPEKYGFMLFGNNWGSKDLHPTMASSLPVYKIKSEGAWGGNIQITNTKFANWLNGKTQCGAKQHIFQRNPNGSDKIPIHYFSGSIFERVDQWSFAWLKDPAQNWANLSDCGQFPCTAPYNVVLKFLYTKWNDAQFMNTFSTSTAPATFQIVGSDGPTVGGAIGNCFDAREYMNGYLCNNQEIGHIQFESLDEDRWDRTFSPISFLNEETGFNNTLNSMMDHVWDGFYTGQVRLTRFPATIQTGQDYTLEFSGTPPKKMRFELFSEIGGTKIRINYPVAGSVAIKANGVVHDYTPWDQQIGAPAALTKRKGCGENRYVGVENYLEFYIMSDCMIEIEPKDSIMTKVRLDWTLAEFYADGGTTRFVDRMAASLGIDAHRIKTVAVYEGSVIVEVYIEPSDDAIAEGNVEQELSSIQAALVSGLSTGEMNLGAPILGVMNVQDGEVLVGDAFENPQPVFEQGENSAIVGDSNLWDDLIWDRIDQNPTPTPTPSIPAEQPPTPVEQPSTPVDEPSTPVDQPSDQVVEPSTPVVQPSTPVDEPSTPVSEPSTPVYQPATPQPSEETISHKPASWTHPSQESERDNTPIWRPEQPSGSQTSQPQTAISAAEEEERAQTRTKIVQVTIEEEYTPEEEDKTSGFIIVIPIIVAVVLLAVATTIIVKCYQSKKKTVAMIQQNMQHQQANVTDQNYLDSQYVLKADDDKGHIFARTSVVSFPNKQRHADSVHSSPSRNVTQMDSVADDSVSHVSHASNSVIKLQSTHKEGQKKLGDDLPLGDTHKKLYL